jgi:hypothetical protein
MEKHFDDLPNWGFRVEEVSSGVYNVKGKNMVFGANLDLTGEDPLDLLQEAKRVAVDMDRQIRRKVEPSE